MIGIVNKAIQDLVIKNFGKQKWHNILKRSGIEENFFISSESYDDDNTFKLALAVSDEMDITVNRVLLDFGKWWVVRTATEKYGGLMKSGETNLREFLMNLPLFRIRVTLIYPKLALPKFKVNHISENSINLHYFSKRKALQEFVRGLIQGLGIMFNTPTTFELLQLRNLGDSHEVFKVSW